MTKRNILVINDHQKIDNVYKSTQEYLESHQEIQEQIATYLWAYHEAQDLIPQFLEQLGSGHFFPFSESYHELENSLELCKQGFYRYSLFALRCVLELGVIGLYYDKDDQAHIDIQGWVRSKDPTPYFQKILSQLFELPYFRQFDEKQPISSTVKRIYGLLNDYVHVRGYKFSSCAQSRSNFNAFNESSLLRYVETMKTIIESVITMMLLKYPIGMQALPMWDKFGLGGPIGGFLDECSWPCVLSVLPDDTKNFLQSISDNDPDVKEIAEHILNMPDLSEEEWARQCAEQDEWYKSHGIEIKNSSKMESS